MDYNNCSVTECSISAEIFENYAEVCASFSLLPTGSGKTEILLPCPGGGIISDLSVFCDGEIFSSAKGVNLREFNASPVQNTVLVSLRSDGLILLTLKDIPASKRIEIKVTFCCVLKRHKNHSAITLLSGGHPQNSLAADINFKINGEVLKALSPTHKITTALSEEGARVSAKAEIFKDSFILDIFYKENQPDGVIISRQPLKDNIALCRFTPRLENVKRTALPLDIYPCGAEKTAEIPIPSEIKKTLGATLSPAYFESVGGINVRLFPSKKSEIIQDEITHIFAQHSVIPPQGLKILDERKNTIEDIFFKTLFSRLRLRPVDIMYAMEKIKALEEKKKSASPEDLCLIREEINEICLNNKIAFGDIALASFSGDCPAGIISMPDLPVIDYPKYFGEDISSFVSEIINHILHSQTADGIIADARLSNPEMLVFSTAVCLIALYLYTKDTHRAFAKRSLDFLHNKMGFWAKTALMLWSGEKTDIDEILKRADMKIMYERIDELAVLLIQNYRRNLK